MTESKKNHLLYGFEAIIQLDIQLLHCFYIQIEFNVI